MNPFPEEIQYGNAGMRGEERLIVLTAPLKRITSFGVDIISKGFISDGCSIPAFAYSLVGHPFSRWLEDAVAHDWDYSVNGTKTRKQADKLLAETMRARGFPTWKVIAFHAAVRIGGGKHFKGKPNN